MALTKQNSIMPIISKVYCSSSQAVLVVRRRPQAVGGGGFVVTNCSQRVVFQVDGCGILGKKGELVLRDGVGDAILLIRQLKGGLVQALSINKKWKGYYDYDGYEKSIFSIKEPNQNACFPLSNAVRVSIEPKVIRDQCNFEVKGYFPDKNCSIVDSLGNIVAQIGMKEEIEKVMTSKDLYHVIVKPGVDQAFVFGVIAVLDYINHESTRC